MVGALGAWVTGGLLASTSMGAAMLGGAIVGAAIGGLSAAITGGNILKGVLFGAVGGAVAGGVAQFVAPGMTSGLSVGSGAESIAAGGSGAPFVQSPITMIGPEVATTVSTSTSTGGFLSTLGTSMLGQGGKSVIGSFLEKGIGGYLAGEEGDKTREAQALEAERAHERNMEKLRFESENMRGGGGSDGAALAYKARMSELDQRKHEFSTQTEQVRKEWDTGQERQAARSAMLGRTGGRGNVKHDTATRGIQEIRQEQQIDKVADRGPVALRGITDGGA